MRTIEVAVALDLAIHQVGQVASLQTNPLVADQVQRRTPNRKKITHQELNFSHREKKFTNDFSKLRKTRPKSTKKCKLTVFFYLRVALLFSQKRDNLLSGFSFYKNAKIQFELKGIPAQHPEERESVLPELMSIEPSLHQVLNLQAAPVEVSDLINLLPQITE